MMTSNIRTLKPGTWLLLALSVTTAVACGADDDDDDGGAGAGARSGGSGSAGKGATGGKAGSGGTSNAGTSGAAGRGGSAAGGAGGDSAGAPAEGGHAGADGGHAGTDGGQAGSDAGGASAGAGAGGESGAAGDLPVELGSAENFVVLAKSAISTVPPSVITGDLGLSPAAASYITGFSLTADASDEFAISAQVTGRIYASDYASPTPADLTTAISDMELAFTDAASRAADVTELGAGNIGGMTLTPGVYAWGTGLLIPTDVTLAGDANAVWIFQIAQNLTVSSATRVALSGGALAKNVFWQVSGSVEFGTTAHFEGIVLTATAVTLDAGASINGRLFAQTAVNLKSSTLVEPSE